VPSDTTAIANLDEGRLGGRQRFAAVLVACGEFIDGYDLLVMGAALILIRPQFSLTPQAIGLLGASTFLGAMIGLLVFGDLSDRLGRRAIFIVNLLFFVVFAIASAFVTSTTQLFAMRFLVGVGVGMDIPTSTAYLAEAAARRGTGLASQRASGSRPAPGWRHELRNQGAV
jgi:MFS transporter, putative metabolite transport protein